VINVVTPVVAGALATVWATLPYLVSLILFVTIGTILLMLHWRSHLGKRYPAASSLRTSTTINQATGEVA